MEKFRFLVRREIISTMFCRHLTKGAKLMGKIADVIIRITSEDLSQMSKLEKIPRDPNSRAMDILLLLRYREKIIHHRDKCNEYIRRYTEYLKYYIEPSSDIISSMNEWIGRIDLSLKSEGVDISELR